MDTYYDFWIFPLEKLRRMARSYVEKPPATLEVDGYEWVGRHDAAEPGARQEGTVPAGGDLDWTERFLDERPAMMSNINTFDQSIPLDPAGLPQEGTAETATPAKLIGGRDVLR